MNHAVLHDEILAGYASGALPPGMALLAAAQLTFSPAARARVAAYESVCGALLEDAAPLTVAPPSLDAALAMLDGAAQLPAAAAPDDILPPPGRRAAADSVMPACLREALGVDETTAPWSFRLPGLSEAVFDGFEGEEVSMLRARPGAPIFSHTHEGVEATLVLSGALEERGQVYRRGDVALATPEVDHRPRILDEGQCICFVVNTGKLRFTGPFSRALNLLAE
ncbi:ChrR family anti-sigma-E factor [Rhodovulum sp. DZ06]|uniref:ChrR family anti-sigma-E factor n=1 Tax=Rhodovulum sp. DZ06 TaxID=3425126 RepID=UPI003D32A9E7